MCSLTYEEWVWVHKWMSLSCSLFLYFSLYSCACVCMCMCAHKTIQHLYSIVSINFFVFFFVGLCLWTVLHVIVMSSQPSLTAKSIIKHRNSTKNPISFFSSDFFDRKWIRDQRQHIFSLLFEIFCMGRNWHSMSILCDLTNNMGQWSDLKMFLSFFLFVRAIFHTLSLLSELDKYLRTSWTLWFMID